MKSIIKIVSALLIAIILTSCNSTPSLQKYIVDGKENDKFICIDLPASILQLKDTEVSEEINNTLNTIKKVNLLGLQVTNTNQELYTSEKEKVKSILKNSKYQQLMRLKIKGANVSVSFLGEDEAIDEVVIFASDDNKGFGIIRVLGENMNPSEILTLSQQLKLDGDSSELKQIEGIFSSL